MKFETNKKYTDKEARGKIVTSKINIQLLFKFNEQDHTDVCVKCFAMLLDRFKSRELKVWDKGE